MVYFQGCRWKLPCITVCFMNGSSELDLQSLYCDLYRIICSFLYLCLASDVTVQPQWCSTKNKYVFRLYLFDWFLYFYGLQRITLNYKCGFISWLAVEVQIVHLLQSLTKMFMVSSWLNLVTLLSAWIWCLCLPNWDGKHGEFILI